jgi:hypothetical protein
VSPISDRIQYRTGILDALHEVRTMQAMIAENIEALSDNGTRKLSPAPTAEQRQREWWARLLGQQHVLRDLRQALEILEDSNNSKRTDSA